MTMSVVKRFYRINRESQALEATYEVRMRALEGSRVRSKSPLRDGDRDELVVAKRSGTYEKL